MINQFRSLNPVNIILLIGTALLLRLGVIFQSAESTLDFAGPFTRFLLSLLPANTFSTAPGAFTALFITIIQAFIFNRVINNYNLPGKPTFLPALLYITCSSLFLSFLIISPALISNFLLIWAIEKFLSIYRRNEVLSVMYDIGMIIALGTLIYFPFIAMMPLLWISMVIFRPFNWREWLAGIIGFITVIFFMWVFYYWNDSTDQFYRIWLPLASKFPVDIRINYYNYLVLIPVIIIVILAIFQLRENFFRSIVQVRKSFQLLIFMLILALVSFYLEPDYNLYHFLLAVPPGSVIMAYYFLHARKRWFYESLYFVLVGFILYFQFA